VSFPPEPSRPVLSWIRRNLALFVSLLLVFVGLSLGVASLASEQTLAYSRTYDGDAVPGNVSLALPSEDVSFLQIDLVTGSCDLRFYPATEADWSRFNTTGTLPGSWIDCGNRQAAISGDAASLILVNEGSGPRTYSVTVEGFRVGTPHAWLALPGTVIALAGLLTFVPRIVTRKALLARSEIEKKGNKK
jgi:hypothetical protein